MLGTAFILPPEAANAQPMLLTAQRGALPVSAPVRGSSPQLQVLGVPGCGRSRSRGRSCPLCPLVPGQSFLGKSCSAQTLPGTWLRCPSSGGHRPLPRDRGQPLASSIAQRRGQRLPPCPSPPHLRAGAWAGARQGRAGWGGSRAGVPAVPAGAAAAATSTQLTQAAARERSPKREMDDKLR